MQTLQELLTHGTSSVMNSVISLLFSVAFAVPPSSTSGIKMGTGTGVVRVSSGVASIDATTDNLPEGILNLYFTNARATAANAASIATKEPLIAAGTSAQYWRGDKTFQTLSTSAVPEGSNLYFTNGRAQSAISASSPLTYSSGAVGCQTASGSQAGCLSSANWTTFNSKLSSVTYTASTPSRALNTNFTPSATNAVFVSYSIGMTCTATILGGQSSTVELRSDTNATPTTVRASINAGNSVSIAISLTAVNTQTVSLIYLVPPGHNVRLVSSGTCTALSIISQSEVSLAFN